LLASSVPREKETRRISLALVDQNEIHCLSKVLGKHQTVQRFKGCKLLNIYVLKKANISEMRNSTKNERK